MESNWGEGIAGFVVPAAGVDKVPAFTHVEASSTRSPGQPLNCAGTGHSPKAKLGGLGREEVPWWGGGTAAGAERRGW